MKPARLQLVASFLLVSLIFFCLAWELWLAPLRPGGSWLALKAVFLLAPLFGILKGNRYTYQWTSLFLLFYLLEGGVRSMSDVGPTRLLAEVELILSLLLFVIVVAYARITRPSVLKKQAEAAEANAEENSTTVTAD